MKINSENTSENTKELFNLAFKRIINLEKDYVNLKDDNGGETYKGISRKFNSSWKGWEIIDQYKDDEYNKMLSVSSEKDLLQFFREFSKKLNTNEKLQELVKEFYNDNYWSKMKLNALSDTPDLAIKLFTLAVNTGTYKTGIKFLQKALNYLNRNGREFPNLVEDGLIGQKTINAYNHLFKTGFGGDILTVIKLLQGRHYLDLMDKHPEYKDFRGWFRRVNCK